MAIYFLTYNCPKIPVICCQSAAPPYESGMKSTFSLSLSWQRSRMHLAGWGQKSKQTKLVNSNQSIIYRPNIYIYIYMGQFAQFGLNGFKRAQTHFSQLHISLDPDKLESCLCSLITVMRRFAKVTCMGCDH